MGRALEIRLDDPRTPAVAALLDEHLAEMARHSPPESMHALDHDGLRAPGVTFWSVWDGARLAGCGALKELGPRHGELKSMRTAASCLRRGVATALLAHILQTAQARGYHRVSLETGAMDAFAPARAFYTRHGFQPCAPFGDYVADPNSVFMTLLLPGTS